MKLKAIIHKDEDCGGYWAEVPALPGCVTQGETLSELKANISEAIKGWLSVDAKPLKRRRNDKIIQVAV